MATKSTMFSRYNLVIRRGQTYSEVSETIRSIHAFPRHKQSLIWPYPKAMKTRFPDNASVFTPLRPPPTQFPNSKKPRRSNERSGAVSQKDEVPTQKPQALGEKLGG